MLKQFKNRIAGTLAVPLGLMLLLIPFSLLMGKNSITLFLFWFVLTPSLAIYLPGQISRHRNHLIESLAGLVIFYAVMIFMIYHHSQSDYFQVMTTSGMINLVLVTVITLLRRTKQQLN